MIKKNIKKMLDKGDSFIYNLRKRETLYSVERELILKW